MAGRFGAWPAIVGTLLTSLLALAFAVPLALGVAIYLTEFAPGRIRRPIATVIELLAAIPSVVWGFIGLTVMNNLIITVRIAAAESTEGP